MILGLVDIGSGVHVVEKTAWSANGHDTEACLYWKGWKGFMQVKYSMVQQWFLFLV